MKNIIPFLLLLIFFEDMGYAGEFKLPFADHLNPFRTIAGAISLQIPILLLSVKIGLTKHLAPTLIMQIFLAHGSVVAWTIMDLLMTTVSMALSNNHSPTIGITMLFGVMTVAVVVGLAIGCTIPESKAHKMKRFSIITICQWAILAATISFLGGDLLGYFLVKSAYS